MGILQKIPRIITQRLMHSVELIIDDNQALLQLFLDLLPKLPPLSRSSSSMLSLDWMRDVYQGALNADDFAELGLSGAR